MLLSALVWARFMGGFACKDAREKNTYIIIEIVLPFLASYQYKQTVKHFELERRIIMTKINNANKTRLILMRKRLGE